jgi:hypothetical protein
MCRPEETWQVFKYPPGRFRREPDVKSEYSGPEWQAIRRRVLARDDNICQIQGPKCRGKATCVDHIVSLSQGGPRLDPKNLQGSCAACNIGKRNSEVAARARGEPVAVDRQWCRFHEQPLLRCGHVEPWSERWY